eukprot:scaffold257743_cov19-Prasinocladus_malaysianus.AAC.1
MLDFHLHPATLGCCEGCILGRYTRAMDRDERAKPRTRTDTGRTPETGRCAEWPAGDGKL